MGAVKDESGRGGNEWENIVETTNVGLLEKLYRLNENSGYSFFTVVGQDG